MIKLYKQIFSILNDELKKKVINLQLINIFQAIIETIALGLIAVLVSIINDPLIINKQIILKPYFEEYFKSDINLFLIYYCSLLFIIIFFSFFLSIFVNTKMLRVGHEINALLENKAFNYYLNKPWIFHVNTSYADIVRKISHDIAIIGAKLIIPSLNISHKIILIIAISFMMFLYNPYIALFGIIIFSLVYFFIILNVKRTIKYQTTLESFLYKEKNETVFNTFQGVKEVILYNLKNFFKTNFNSITYAHIDPAVKLGLIVQIPRLVVEGISYSIIIMFILFALLLNFGMDSILPTIALYAFAGLKLLPAFQQIYMAVVNIRNGKVLFDRYKDKLAVKINDNFQTRKNKKALEFLKSFSLEKIKFKYNKNKKTNQLSIKKLEIKKNSIIGIAGTTGSGKSTLIDIFTTLILPDSGKIYVDKKRLDKKMFKLWMNNFAIVPQSPFFSNLSILENVAFGLNKKDVKLNKVMDCIKMANLSKRINSFSQGIYTKIGDRGLRLSGGERQRLAIARALYSEKKIIIFDEATSAVDSETEKEIVKSITNLKKQKTMIIIAHRINTLKICDKIYLMKNGRISGSGSYNNLLKKNSYFKKLNG